MFQGVYPHAETGCAVLIHDDGRGAWAYLRDPEGALIADVWLYNRVEPPEVLELADARAAPFLNPRALAKPLSGALPRSAKSLDVTWTYDDALLLAHVWLNGVLLARLAPGSQPGWSALALEDGPLARVLEPDAE